MGKISEQPHVMHTILCSRETYPKNSRDKSSTSIKIAKQSNENDTECSENSNSKEKCK